MLSAVCKLLTDEADAVEVSTHCEFLVLSLWLFCRCTFLCEGLLVERKGENNVGAQLACVKLAVEASKFNRVVSVKKAMQIQKMVAT